MNRKIALFAALLLLNAGCASLVEPSSQPSSLVFVHLNDTYRIGAVEDGNAGGFGRVVTIIRDLQQQGHDVRILHGGDFLYPSLESQLWDGEQMVDAFNFMDDLAPMYVVAGNHEFDPRGSQQLVDVVKQSRFDWLGDNYRFATGEDDVDQALKAAFTFQHGDKTIGLFAITLHPVDGGTDRAYAPTDKRYVEIAESTIASLEAAGVDAIIGLTHLHMWQDLEIAQLRAQHPTLVMIAGGHEHEPEHSRGDAGNAAVIKGASNARSIWVAELTFDDSGVPSILERQLELDQRVATDPEYQQLDTKWRNRLLEKFPFLEAKVGEAALSMDSQEATIRNRESSWGNFVVDQMRGAFGEQSDLAFINSGTLRIDDMIDGDIAFEDIGRTFGFSSFLRHTTVSGAEFKEIMEAGYRGFGPSKGYFPQLSGFRVCIDRSRKEFDRIVSLQVPSDDGWQEIDVGKNYSLVVPDFLYGGGDGYEIPKDRPASRPASELKYLVLDAVLRAQAQGEKVGEAITDENRRFHQLLESKEPCF